MTMGKNNKASILGIGNDIIEIERIRSSILSHEDRFIKRLFTSMEQVYCLRHQDSAPHFAARFAAKEAIAKALGTGFGEHLSWLDIEIINDAKGKPEVSFSEKARQEFNNPQILLSMSHCQLYASAVAILLPEEP
jgi:holo-[acyl-carrier protein] synthase